jgi:hypothetical protein
MYLVLQLGEEPLRSVTRRFQHDYARIFNCAHGERGSLFRLHYRTFLFDHTQWLVPVVRHVHSLRYTEVADEDCPRFWWNSDAVYRGDERRSLVTTNVVLRMLERGPYDRQRQERAYRLLFDEPTHCERALPFASMRKLDARILGDAEFVAAIWNRSGQGATRRRQDPGGIELAMAEATRRIVDGFLSVCHARLPSSRSCAWASVVTYDAVRSRSRRRPLPMVRALCALHLIERRIATAKEVARFFACGSTPVSARRRHFYTENFRECFGVAPEALLEAQRFEEPCLAGECRVLARPRNQSIMRAAVRRPQYPKQGSR